MKKKIIIQTYKDYTHILTLYFSNESTQLLSIRKKRKNKRMDHQILFIKKKKYPY